jgi:hypothetical protein
MADGVPTAAGTPPQVPGQPAEQLAVGVVLLPFLNSVIPKLLPLPFGRAVRVPLVPLTDAFQLF